MSSLNTIHEEKIRYKPLSIDDSEIHDSSKLTVAVVGNVDSGKSSLTGCLISGTLDDGNGKSRSVIFKHPHEHETGRTSDVSYTYNIVGDKLITFIDLAGHEQYLKTTVTGLTAGTPDMAIVCISDKITKMTTEHMGLCISLGIPMLILFTKVDFIPADITAKIMTGLGTKLRMTKRKLFHIRNVNDFKSIVFDSTNKIIPFCLISNKTGQGHDLIKAAFAAIKKKERLYLDGFVVEHIYNKQGHGTIISGETGINIKQGDRLYMGPFDKDGFLEVTVKSIHNDFRYEMKELPANSRGCLCIKISNAGRKRLRAGMIVRQTIPPAICKKFKVKVQIFHHHTTIQSGYEAFANCGMIREPIRFEKIEVNDVATETIKSGEEAIVTMQFIKNYNYLEIGQQIVFREGTTRGIGYVVELC